MTSAWPRAVSAADLLASPPPTPPELIHGMLYRGGTLMLSGPSKSRKTYTLLELALAVASGAEWLGFKTSPAPVAYINLELQGHAVARRLGQICSARGIEAPANLHFLNLRGLWVTADELRRRLPKLIAELGLGLVVIDPHYKVSSASGADENSNNDQGRLLADMEGMCNPHGAALVIAHHFAKGDASAKNAMDRASGAGVMARFGDAMLTMTPHEEEEAMTVEMALRNFAPVAPFAVRWEHPRWARDGSLDPAKLKTGGAPMKHPPEKALRALGDKMMGYGEWLKASGMSATTFDRRRQELLEAGKVEVRGSLYRALVA